MVLDAIRKMARFPVLIKRESCEVEEPPTYRNGDDKYEW